MRTPAFWSHDTMLSRALSPLGSIYAAATRWRLGKPPKYRAPISVVCVGNATAGGSGKTPTVQMMAKAAIARGLAVHCISRGYGGSLKGPLRVDPAIHSAADVGDEPLLLASIAPTWIARDRAEGARAAVAAGAQVLILDDGLQNPDVAYSLSIMVIDGGFGFGNGRCIPAGPLREPVAVAAARVNSVVLIGDDVTNCLAQLPPGLQIVRARIVPQKNNLAGKKVVAFAGLGRPEKFRETLSAMGADIVSWHPFPDHHIFSKNLKDNSPEFEALVEIAKEKGAKLVTTEKDFVRLPTKYHDQVLVVAIDLVTDGSYNKDDPLGKVPK